MKYKKFTLGFVLLAIMLTATACVGTTTTESRTVSDFDNVQLLGSGDLIITQGDTSSLTVETNDNLMQYVHTDVRDGTLYLSYAEEDEKSYSYTKLDFALTVTELSGVTTTGSGDVIASSLNADHFDVTATGSGKVTIDTLVTETLDVQIRGSGDVSIAGETNNQTVTTGGSGTYRAGDMQSKTAVMDIGGSGKATVWVTDSLDVDVTGNGNVNYYGSPTVSSNITGSGSIDHITSVKNER